MIFLPSSCERLTYFTATSKGRTPLRRISPLFPIQVSESRFRQAKAVCLFRILTEVKLICVEPKVVDAAMVRLSHEVAQPFVGFQSPSFAIPFTSIGEKFAKLGYSWAKGRPQRCCDPRISAIAATPPREADVMPDDRGGDSVPATTVSTFPGGLRSKRQEEP